MRKVPSQEPIVVRTIGILEQSLSGLFFFGAPNGQDAIVFNLHRIYGPIRFAMMMTGYELVDVYSEHKPEAFDLKTDDPFLREQKTFVLKKV